MYCLKTLENESKLSKALSSFDIITYTRNCSDNYHLFLFTFR